MLFPNKLRLFCANGNFICIAHYIIYKLNLPNTEDKIIKTYAGLQCLEAVKATKKRIIKQNLLSVSLGKYNGFDSVFESTHRCN